MLFMLLLAGTYKLNIQTINKSISFFFHPFHEEISDVACEKFIHAIDTFPVVFNRLNSIGLACGHIAFVIVKSKCPVPGANCFLTKGVQLSIDCCGILTNTGLMLYLHR